MQTRSLRTILLGNVHQEVANTPRVTPLIVVPRDQLDEVLVQLDTGLGIEDGRSRVANEIGRDDLLISVLDDVLVSALRSCFDDSLDFIIGSLLLEADDEVDDGDIEGGDTETKTGKLAVEGRNDLADSLCSTSGRGDDVTTNGTATTPVLVGGTVDGLLGCGRRVNGGHQTLDDTKLVVDDLGERGQAVGGAGSVGNDGVLRVVGIQVDTANEHWGIGRRSGDDDLLGTALQMGRGLFGGGENTSGLDDVISTDGAPRDLSGILLSENGDGFALDPELAILGLNGSLEPSVDGIILEHVDHVFKVNEGIVDSNHLDFSDDESITEDNTTDTTKTVDPDFYHRCSK